VIVRTLLSYYGLYESYLIYDVSYFVMY
jgi:hypothetical protein